MAEWAPCPVGVNMTLSWPGQRGCGLPSLLLLSTHCPLEGLERWRGKPEQEEEQETRKQEKWGERGGKGRRRRMDCGGRWAGERRRQDGGGAAHFQIKFVIQASDGPTARD